MAVKPLVQPEIWASNALYTTGPFIGSASKVVPGAGIAAEGHRPGANFPTPAEYENSQQNRITGLCQWVFAGSAAGAADAHIVETDAAGRATLHGLTVNDTADETAVVVVGVSTIVPTVTVGNISGGAAIAALTGDTAATCISAQTGNSTGTGVGVIMAGTAVGGAGVRVFGSVFTTADGLVIDHNGPSGRGAVIETAGTDTALVVTTTGTGAKAAEFEADDDAAIYAEGGVTSSAAILAVGKVDAAGLRASGGPGGANGVEGVGTGTGTAGVYGVSDAYGVYGIATDSATGFGIHGESDNTATSTAGGVHGVGQANGTGVLGEAVDGYAGLFTANGSRPTVLLTARPSDPTATAPGALWHRTNRGLSTFQQSVARLLWHTAGGSGTTWGSSQIGGGATVSNAPTAIITCSLTGADAPVALGTVWIFFTMEVGRTAGSPDLAIQIGDDTNTSYPITETVQLYQTGGAGVYERNVVYLIPYTLTGIGITQFSATISSTLGGGSTLNYRNAAMAIIGVF